MYKTKRYRKSYRTSSWKRDLVKFAIMAVVGVVVVNVYWLLVNWLVL